MDKIASLMKLLAPLDGSNATNLPGTAIYKDIQHKGRQPFLYYVGYESAAQFSREFKRYFGNSPGECRSNVSGRQNDIGCHHGWTTWQLSSCLCGKFASLGVLFLKAD